MSATNSPINTTDYKGLADNAARALEAAAQSAGCTATPKELITMGQAWATLAQAAATKALADELAEGNRLTRIR